MKINLTEDRLEKFIFFLEKSINDLITDDDVCRIGVDYDEQMDKFVFNVFFSRQKAKESGAKHNSNLNLVINNVGKKIKSVFGMEPYMYLHYEDC